MPGNEEPNAISTTPTSERPRSFFARNSVSNGHNAGEEEDVEGSEEEKPQPPTKWSMGILNDRSTNEVPGTFAGFWNIEKVIELIVPLCRVCPTPHRSAQ